MKQISPPRVQGAVLSTIWNRWTTEARMQQTRRQRCLLCRAEDSRDAIEHYATCPMTRRLMSARLNMEPDVFANLHSWTLCSPCIRTEEQLLCIGIAIYAVYNTTNKLRRAERLNCLSMEDRYQALAQSVKEAVRGHHKAVATLSQRWTRSREEQPLSFSFEVWDMDVASKKKCIWDHSARKQRCRLKRASATCMMTDTHTSTAKRRRTGNSVCNIPPLYDARPAFNPSRSQSRATFLGGR